MTRFDKFTYALGVFAIGAGVVVCYISVLWSSRYFLVWGLVLLLAGIALAVTTFAAEDKTKERPDK